MHPYDGRVVSNFIMQALSGADITIYGDGSQTRSFCFVDDLVEAIFRMMNQDTEVGPVNIGNPVETTIKQLAELCIELTGSSSNLIMMPLPGDDPKQRKPDITKAKAVLDGWEPQIQVRVQASSSPPPRFPPSRYYDSLYPFNNFIYDTKP